MRCKFWEIKEISFNINKTKIHFPLAIPLNRGIHELESFPNGKKGIIIKSHDQLCLLIINEISLVRN